MNAVHSRVRPALARILDISHPAAAGAFDSDTREKAATSPQKRAAAPLNPQAVSLLGQVMARTSTSDPKIIQFLSARSGERATRVAQAFAAASAAWFGRTLLLSLDEGFVFEDNCPHERLLSTQPVPDSAVRGLYHAILDPRSMMWDHRGEDFRSGLVASASTSRMFVIDSAPPVSCPTSFMLAPSCTGTVVVVHAGRTPMRAVKEAVQAVTSAGGRILGLVLDDAPTRVPRPKNANGPDPVPHEAR